MELREQWLYPIDPVPKLVNAVEEQNRGEPEAQDQPASVIRTPFESEGHE
jgi:hypothetical protein